MINQQAGGGQNDLQKARQNWLSAQAKLRIAYLEYQIEIAKAENALARLKRLRHAAGLPALIKPQAE